MATQEVKQEESLVEETEASTEDATEVTSEVESIAVDKALVKVQTAKAGTYNADIFIGGLESGSYTLRLKAAGFMDYVQDVEVNGNILYASEQVWSILTEYRMRRVRRIRDYYLQEMLTATE